MPSLIFSEKKTKNKNRMSSATVLLSMGTIIFQGRQLSKLYKLLSEKGSTLL